MKLACIAFADNGLSIAERIRASQCFEVDIFDKLSYKEQLQNIFNKYKGIVFIGSTGIAVRLCAPFLIHKTIDPAVVVVDDLCRFSISLVSGHLGGANHLAQKLSEILQCQPVITTASDGRNIEAVDMFAMNNGLYIESMEDAKKITALMIKGERIQLISEKKLQLGYGNVGKENIDGIIFVTSQQKVSCDKPHCVLRTRNLNIGIGCRRGKSKQEIVNAIKRVFENNDLSLKSINKIATIDIKRDEEGIIQACKELERPMVIFDKFQISTVAERFEVSDFVKSKVGVASVSEPCAFLAGGSIIVGKQIIDGITIAVAKED